MSPLLSMMKPVPVPCVTGPSSSSLRPLASAGVAALTLTLTLRRKLAAEEPPEQVVAAEIVGQVPARAAGRTS